MYSELLEIIKRYLEDMVERGDYEAHDILKMIKESEE